MPRPSPRSLRQEYQQYVEREVEDYKNSVSTEFMYGIAQEAARALEEAPQLGIREVMLADEVDRLITKRLRLPSYETWRRRREKNANELKKPERWGLRSNTPLRAAMALPWRRVKPLAPVTARFLGLGRAAASRACGVCRLWKPRL